MPLKYSKNMCFFPNTKVFRAPFEGFWQPMSTTSDRRRRSIIISLGPVEKSQKRSEEKLLGRAKTNLFIFSRTCQDEQVISHFVSG